MRCSSNSILQLEEWWSLGYLTNLAMLVLLAVRLEMSDSSSSPASLLLSWRPLSAPAPWLLCPAWKLRIRCMSFSLSTVSSHLCQLLSAVSFAICFLCYMLSLKKASIRETEREVWSLIWRWPLNSCMASRHASIAVDSVRKAIDTICCV